MNSIPRVKQMAHLKQKQIGDNSCKAIIIDTLLEAVHPLTKEELSGEIESLFHVLVSSERLEQLINSLHQEKFIFFDAKGHIEIASTKKASFIAARLHETELREKATQLWIEHLRTTQQITSELDAPLSQALPIFLRSLFIKHGVSSYELLTSIGDGDFFDLKQLAHDVSRQFDEAHRDNIATILPTIFQIIDQPTVIEFLKHSIEKAIGYISEVISDENLSQITDSLKDLTIYLDTNTIYRLLNLQGVAHYESIKETLDFCRTNGAKLKISALTKMELSSRLKFDARVLMKFPTRTNLSNAGYKYRSSDNYISTYWQQSSVTKVSVSDFIEYYQNFDILLETEQIEIEEIEVDEQSLIDKAKHFFEKMSLRDSKHEKSDSVLWHDAYNFAYVQKMQKTNAKNAVDTQCLFLTTDYALIAFQREDHEVKESPPVVIAPSQLLQMFAFSKADSGYEETFIKFFASSSLGVSFEYSNDDIQEILSRIDHYKGITPEIAERILARELINSRYSTASTDEEKEEIIYNSVSYELLSELDLTKEQIATLQSEKEQLNEDRRLALDLLMENGEQFKNEKLRLQAEAEEARQQRDAEVIARKHAETDSYNVGRYSAAQEELYIKEKMTLWERRHRIWFGIGAVLSIAIVILSVYLWWNFKDSGYFGLLSALALPIIPLTIGGKVFSSNERLEARQKILEDYHEKLGKMK